MEVAVTCGVGIAVLAIVVIIAAVHSGSRTQEAAVALSPSKLFWTVVAALWVFSLSAGVIYAIIYFIVVISTPLHP